VRIDVDTLPAPIAIRGPWKLRFPPGLGAPDSIELDALGSWTENANPGVRTFSGTATYETEFDLPAGLFESDGVLRLDLGRVECLAEVELNGVDLGTWWKPPFVADVRTAAQVGRNRLVVRVTNLWVNRLIGDEQLPPIAEYVGKQLKEWPAWLRDGQTPPTTGRVTFSTWRHYKPDSPLLLSGLLGPVTIVAGARALIGAR
jgi:hypothetical protein